MLVQSVHGLGAGIAHVGSQGATSTAPRGVIQSLNVTSSSLDNATHALARCVLYTHHIMWGQAWQLPRGCQVIRGNIDTGGGSDVGDTVSSDMSHNVVENGEGVSTMDVIVLDWFRFLTRATCE